MTKEIKEEIQSYKHLTEHTNTRATNIELTGIEKLDEYIRRFKLGEEITEISLSGLDINLEMAETIGETLNNIPNLQVLNLTHNSIAKDGLAKILLVLKENKTLQLLNLSSNNINLNKTKPIVNFIEDNKTLHTLDLSHNTLGSSGIRLLSEVLERNKTLQNLYFSDNQIIAQGYDHLSQALEKNTTLLSLGTCHHEECNRIIERNKDLKRKESIEKIEVANTLKIEVAKSDVKILPSDLLNITTLFDERILEGENAENFLRRDGSYEQYFGQKDLPEDQDVQTTLKYSLESEQKLKQNAPNEKIDENNSIPTLAAIIITDSPKTNSRELVSSFSSDPTVIIHTNNSPTNISFPSQLEMPVSKSPNPRNAKLLVNSDIGKGTER